MITITFDEKGSFEHIHSEQEHIFITGFLYDDRGIQNETSNERERIKRYYKAVCQTAGTIYPVDLHVDHGNSTSVAKTKQTVRKTLGSFLKDGVFKDPENPGAVNRLGMDERKGKYYLFAKVRSEKGRTDYLGSNINSLIRDTYASNLYIHMVEESLEVLLLHNPLLTDIKEIFLDLPSRLAMTDGSKEQYDLLDYHEYSEINPEVGSGKVMVGNADVYRTSMDRIIRDAQGQRIKNRDFRVTSIKYEMEDPSINKSTNSMTFLFMADTLCSLLGFENVDEKPSEWINIIRSTFKELTGHSQNFVFAYDDADVYFQKANLAFEQKDLFAALNALYEGRNCGSTMVNYYAETWYRILENRIAACKDQAAFTSAARNLRAVTYSNKVDQQSLQYCFEILEKTAGSFDQKEIMPAVYALYDAGTSIYNHAGQSEKAQECQKKCAAASKSADIDQFMRSRNKLTVSLCDQLKFEEALKSVNESLDVEEVLSTARMIMSDDGSEDSTTKARALSQRGQVYAFMRDANAEKDFFGALKIFEPNDVDYLITLSYLLQYYLDTQEKDKYEKYAEKYFRSRELYSQFTNMLNDSVSPQSRLNMRFSLFIFVKAIWSFYKDEVPVSLKKVLVNIEKSISDRRKELAGSFSGHPYQLIYKYLAFCAYHWGDLKTAEAYIRKAQTAVQDSSEIIKQINAETLNEYKRLQNGEDITDSSSDLTYMYR